MELTTIFGVRISVKPCSSSVRRKPRSDAAASRQYAAWAGCRQSTGAWSSNTGRVAVIDGRHSSTGGVSAGSDSAVTDGAVTSKPPGALSLAVTVPSTSTTVSSGSSSSRALVGSSLITTWARPERSRRIRNDTADSRRRRCTQPRSTTRSSLWPASASLSVRCTMRKSLPSTTHRGTGTTLLSGTGAPGRGSARRGGGPLPST